MPADGAHDLVAGAVVEGDDRAGGGRLPAVRRLGLLDQAGDVGRQPLALADDADADALRVQIGEVAADEEAEQAEQETRPRPAAATSSPRRS